MSTNWEVDKIQGESILEQLGSPEGSRMGMAVVSCEDHFHVSILVPGEGGYTEYTSAIIFEEQGDALEVVKNTMESVIPLLDDDSLPIFQVVQIAQQLVDQQNGTASH